VGLVGLGVLVRGVAAGDEPLDWLPILVFATLSLLVQQSSFHFGTSIVHSFVGVIDLAAVLALGPLSGALVAAASGLAYLVLRALHHRRFNYCSLVQVPLFNSGLKAVLALVGGALFEAFAGPLPLGSDKRCSGGMGCGRLCGRAGPRQLRIWRQRSIVLSLPL